MEIVGYTHSDGYCLCPQHAFETYTLDGQQATRLKPDSGNEWGVVLPIWNTDEFTSVPTCEIDHEPLEVVVIGV